MKYAIFITGSAGAAKSTTTMILHEHFDILKRRNVLFNLDPACDFLPYQPELDIRELVTSVEVQEVTRLGPNGALIYAFNYFFSKEHEFLQENMDYEDDFLIFDCPGQIELYIQHNELQKFAKQLMQKGYECICLYLMDSTKLLDTKSFLTNILISNCVMLNLNMPFLLVATKTDLVDIEQLKRMIEEENRVDDNFYQNVYQLCQNMIGNVKLMAYNSEELITDLQQEIDYILHYGEND